MYAVQRRPSWRSWICSWVVVYLGLSVTTGPSQQAHLLPPRSWAHHHPLSFGLVWEWDEGGAHGEALPGKQCWEGCSHPGSWWVTVLCAIIIIIIANWYCFVAFSVYTSISLILEGGAWLTVSLGYSSFS